MAIKKQISIVLQNKVGELFEVCDALRRRKVNLIAFCIHSLRDFGVLRIVVNNPGVARKALKSMRLSFTASDVAIGELPNVPGALAKVTKKLARAGINIEYAYASATDEKSLVIFKVSETAKASRLLE